MTNQNFEKKRSNWLVNPAGIENSPKFPYPKKKLNFFVPDVFTSIPVIILRLGVLKRCLKQKF